MLSFLSRLSVLLFLLSVNVIYAQTGPNLALNKPVTSSSTVVTNPSLSALTDGDITTWTGTNNTAAPPNAEWLQIDLGSDQLIEYVRISTRSGQHDRGRRFMIVTWPSQEGVTGLGNQPNSYLTDASSSIYNRLGYTNATSVGVSTGNLLLGGSVPGAAGVNLGPDYTSRTLNVGIHKARYIMILTLQDDYLDLGEVEVYGTNAVPQRSLLNGDFETGLTFGGGTFDFLHEANIVGWNATEVVAMGNGDGNPDNGSFIEIWGNGLDGVPANQGTYFAELNAYSNGELVQPVCVLSGETFNWSLAHRGRAGVDVMRLRINDVDVAEFSDNNAVTGTHTGTVLDPSTTTISSSVSEGSGWYQYSGTWTNTTGGPITAEFGFRAVSSAGGTIGAGNFLDDISITSLSPFISLPINDTSGAENIPNANLPKLTISGTVSSGASLQLSLSGTATRGVDYTTIPATGIITVPIPAGTYDGTAATAISLAPYIHINSDLVTPEPNETIIIQAQNPVGITIGDGQNCNTIAVDSSIYTIIDYPVCYRPGITTSGTMLDTPFGITSLGRAGINNSSWPMVRKGAWLALESKSKGFVVNRLTTVQKNALTAVEGMMVYDTDLDCLSIYDGTGWKCFSNQTCPD